MAQIDFSAPKATGERLEDLLKETRAWGNLTAKQLRFRVASLGLKDRVRIDGEVKLIQSIRSSTRSRGGEVQSVAFSFVRHGIFLERGVGRGRKPGTAQAIAASRPWLRPVLEPAVDELANLLAEKYADLAAGELKLTIPGVLTTKVKI